MIPFFKKQEKQMSKKSKSFNDGFKQQVTELNIDSFELDRAVKNGDTAKIEELLFSDKDLPLDSPMIRSALYTAAKEGQAASARFILGKGVSPDSVFGIGGTIEDIARRQGHTDVVAEFEKARAAAKAAPESTPTGKKNAGPKLH